MPCKHVTLKRVPKGTVIHEEKPFIHVLQSDLRAIRCDHCYSKTDLLRCSGCAYVRYCDISCQKAEWPDHKVECSRIRTIPPNLELPNAARLLAKIIMKLKRGGDAEKGFYGKQSFRMFKDLMSHYPDIKSDSKRMEHAKSLYGVLIDFLGKDSLPNYPEFLGIYGRMIVNGFSILDGEMTTLGTGIYLGASTIDHSCTPNSVAVFSGTTLSIRTIEDISDYDWSKVRISYVEGLGKKEERHSELWSTYYFVCDCKRCTEEESIETAAVCQACNSIVYSNQMVCSKCDWKASDAFIEKYKEAIEFCNFQHQEMKNVAYLDACKLCLKKEKGFIHPASLVHAKTLDLAFEAAIQLNSWEEAMKLGYELIPVYRKFYGECHPLTGLHLMKLGKILLYLGNENYLEILERAEKIMRVTYGTRHQAYRRMLEPLLIQARGLLGQIVC
ncbi:histone-lysine N-methyltransferase SMYD3 isoform X1 [Halyomorpha halys]|uniref:histone-lysine N-methyltransferase SMYD3 isoform X1 n=1 Tax=Halyomorpha halys TaxID=286706 RepID=UPI0006D4FFA9|nr:histone-lysine N-methyltransferase SMYD3 [Halyomorpha halys]